MTTTPPAAAVDLAQVRLADWNLSGPKATYTLDGVAHSVTLDQAATALRRFQACIYEAAKQEAVASTADMPDADWIEGTPLWGLFEQQTTEELAHMIAAFYYLVASADVAGELAAGYMQTARQTEMTFTPATDA